MTRGVSETLRGTGREHDPSPPGWADRMPILHLREHLSREHLTALTYATVVPSRPAACGSRTKVVPSARARREDMVTVLESFALTGKKALVTGGNQGLGKAFAAALAQAGAQVVIVARDAARNAAAVRELASQGLAVSALDADITARRRAGHRPGRRGARRPGVGVHDQRRAGHRRRLHPVGKRLAELVPAKSQIACSAWSGVST